ncbi:GNAT family N-acetyltransferase [Aminobacter carboxidus]|uniref:GNAT family N-acetyltransferase n=1 Tax=Aminobacter carboxidus TaxID=376165 RepID=A0ABR9GPB5_9HYPH|nr:GNAT family N-acetyltransferase [Aminobacter carboxidus]MBE1205527.1 GNAT family N-acetyltransferase [Aminobacter carboxidus]
MPDAGSTAAFSFEPAKASDFERLFDIRLLAMRDSLERIGRFDPERARRRFGDGFRPEHTRLILGGGQLIGCVAFGPHDGAILLEHFYLVPKAQGHGIGAAVLRQLLDEADAAGLAVRLDVLRGSDAKRLYDRHGFVETRSDELDIYMERQPSDV